MFGDVPRQLFGRLLLAQWLLFSVVGAIPAVAVKTPASPPPPHDDWCHTFKCHDGPCISNEARCDGFMDCPKEDDEKNCPVTKTCDESQFRCQAEGSCIPRHWVCDEMPDCSDKSDEDDQMCAGVAKIPDRDEYMMRWFSGCSSHQFSCMDHEQCVDRTKLCDGS